MCLVCRLPHKLLLQPCLSTRDLPLQQQTLLPSQLPMPLPLLLQRLQPTTLLAQALTASTTAMPMQMPSPQCCRIIRPLLLLLESQLPFPKAVQSQQPPVLPSQRPSTTWDATMALELHSSVRFHCTQQKPVGVLCCLYALLFMSVRVPAVLLTAPSLTKLSQIQQ